MVSELGNIFRGKKVSIYVNEKRDVRGVYLIG
jgi:hypothetical protein